MLAFFFVNSRVQPFRQRAFAGSIPSGKALQNRRKQGRLTGETLAKDAYSAG
jgi:hypothetical protein